MTMTASMISRTIHRGVGASSADVSVDKHERLALALLAVEVGDVADVEDAMRKIIASAPAATDVAMLLCLALAHAGDRALTADVRTRSSVGRQGAFGRVK
jgi:hypothetical protein